MYLKGGAVNNALGVPVTLGILIPGLSRFAKKRNSFVRLSHHLGTLIQLQLFQKGLCS